MTAGPSARPTTAPGRATFTATPNQPYGWILADFLFSAFHPAVPMVPNGGTAERVLTTLVSVAQPHLDVHDLTARETVRLMGNQPPAARRRPRHRPHLRRDQRRHPCPALRLLDQQRIMSVRGNQCVEYDLRAMAPEPGQPLTDAWPGLVKTFIGAHLYTGSLFELSRLDLTTGEVEHVAEQLMPSPSDLNISPDQRMLLRRLNYERAERAVCRDVLTGDIIGTSVRPLSTSYAGMAFSPDGATCSCASDRTDDGKQLAVAVAGSMHESTVIPIADGRPDLMRVYLMVVSRDGARAFIEAA
ncbi:hypothetical protein SSP35_04_02770 [Streptomyces sp. NBRC 110611]|uniref:hypothetical protein n=1 Tax=Streptomyces sp. NBRC 110611 TaxID=1621259 RepID=UPI0008552007|nr:hypothetical protein [Streptomyces sp. NBRC 110611]GAU67194.1 hypothetical protein SSP35_04_02770 [Streptomyces sp. NBRC 110611]